MNIAVLGAGMVGRAIALDLAKEFAVTSFDLDAENLNELKARNASIQTVGADLSQFSEYKDWLIPFDMAAAAASLYRHSSAYRAKSSSANEGSSIVKSASRSGP